MNGDESALLRIIEEKVDGMVEACSAIPYIREDVSALVEHQKEQNGRLTAVERDTLIARGGLMVLAFIVASGIAIASIVAAITW